MTFAEIMGLYCGMLGFITCVIAGWIKGVHPVIIILRALVGLVALYIAGFFAGRVFLDAMVKSATSSHKGAEDRAAS